MSVALMQLSPQSLPLTQFGVFRPPVAIEAVDGTVRLVIGAGDCVGGVAGFGFVKPENRDGFLAGAGEGGAVGAIAATGLVSVFAPAGRLLHEIRL